MSRERKIWGHILRSFQKIRPIGMQVPWSDRTRRLPRPPCADDVAAFYAAYKFCQVRYCVYRLLYASLNFSFHLFPLDKVAKYRQI